MSLAEVVMQTGCGCAQVTYMNQVLDASPSSKPLSQSMGRQGLGLELTNQRSVSSVLTKATEYNLHPQQIADAGLQVISSTNRNESSVLS